MKRSGIFILLEIFLCFIVLYLPDNIIPLFTDTLNLFDNLLALILYSFLYIIQIGLLFLYILHGKKENAADWGLGSFGLNDVKHSFYLYIMIFCLYFIIVFIANFLPEEILNWLAQGHSWSLNQISLAPIILIFSLLVGLKEEMFFRAFFINGLKLWGLPAWAAILLSSSFFGVLHLYEGIIALIFAMGSALLFGYLYLRWKNVFVLAIGHGMFNFTILVLSYFLKDQIL